MRHTRLALERPVTTVMIALALLAIGVISARLLRLEAMPDITFPGMMVTIPYPGSTPEEIYVCHSELSQKYGKDMKHIPLGAIGIYTFSQKIKVGLQQLMAGARCFSVPAISRNELMSLTEECAKVTGIPYLMEAYRKDALKILKAK